jgi:hypothetical protein
MLSTKKNLLGLKSFAGLALRYGCNSFGFLRIGFVSQHHSVVFVFKKELKAMAFFQRVVNLNVFGVYRRQSYKNNFRYYLVIISLPDQFRFTNPLQNKLHYKTLQSFCLALGSAVQIGNPYSHPHLKLKNSIPTQYTTIN